MSNFSSEFPELSSPNERSALSSLDDEILEIEREMEGQVTPQKELIADLKFERNGRLPVSQLPVEILCTIFHLVREYESYCYGEFDFGWACITHVCRHWRVVALNEPFLWTRPPFDCPIWATAMLERSRMANLFVMFNSSSKLRQDLLSSVLLHSPRIIEISISRIRPLEAMENLFETFGAIPAPKLRSVSLQWCDEYGYRVRNPDYPRLQKTTFAGYVNLRRLTLNAVNPDWTSLVFSSLTSLSIANVSENARPSPSQFLDVLAMMPGLISLDLYKTFPTKHDILAYVSPMERRRVPLHSLEELSIGSNAMQSEFFWTGISISSCLRDIYSRIEFDSNNNPPLLRMLAAIHASDSLGHLEKNTRSVSISVSSVTSTTFHGLSMSLSSQTSAVIEDDTPPDSLSQRSFQWKITLDNLSESLEYSAQSGDISFTDFFNGMHWGQLRELNLDDFRVARNLDRFSSQTLARTFGSLTGLQTVIMGHYSAKPVIEALVVSLNQPDSTMTFELGTTRGTTAFPDLRRLEFRGVGFDSPPGVDSIHGLQSFRLHDCLLRRRERKADIHTISVKSCRNFGEKQRNLLEEVVCVDWDGENVWFVEIINPESDSDSERESGYSTDSDD